jgi:hypothetical protein
MPPARSAADRLALSFRTHPDWDDERRSNAVKLPIAQVRAYRAARKGGSIAPSAKTRGHTLQQFKSLFDVKERIRSGIKTHLGTLYLTDQEFREACEIPAQEWRRNADLEEFGMYRWRYKTILYWAHPRTLETMKETVGAV